MSVTQALLTHGSDPNDKAAGVPFQGASIAPSADKVIVCIWYGGRTTAADPGSPTISGNGITFTQKGSVLSGTNQRLGVAIGKNASPTPGAPSLTWAVGMSFAHWAFIQLDGNDVDLLNVIVQLVTGTGTSAPDLTLNLAAFGSATNAVIAAYAVTGGPSTPWFTPEAGWTEIFENTGGTNAGLAAQFKASADTTAVGDWTGNRNCVGIAFEIKELTAQDYLSVEDEPTNTQEDTVIAPPITVAKRKLSDNTIDTTYNGLVTAALSSGPGVLQGTTQVNAVNGVATFSDLKVTVPATGYTLIFTATGIDQVESAAFNITEAPATKFIFATQPSEVDVGAVITPPVVVHAVNPDNELDETWEGSATISTNTHPSGAALQGTTTRQASGGVLTYDDLSLSLPGVGVTLKVVEA